MYQPELNSASTELLLQLSVCVMLVSQRHICLGFSSPAEVLLLSLFNMYKETQTP